MPQKQEPYTLKVERPAIAWVLLATRKVKQIGIEPYPFTPGTLEGVVVECYVGWQDEGHVGDGVMEYDASQGDKLEFIRAFKSLYPKGTIAFIC